MNPHPIDAPRTSRDSRIADGARAPAPASRTGGAVRLDHVVAAARCSLGSAAAGAFLNAHHRGLAAQPLALAAASEAGLAAVETAICVEARRGLESC